MLIAHILRKMLASVGGAGVGGGLQPLPAVQGAGAVGMRAPQFEARGNVNVGPASQLKSIAGQVTSLEDQRGDLCGDPCLTIELSEKKSAAAVWDEENFSVIHLTAVDKNKKEVTRMPSSMSINGEKDYKVLKLHLANAAKQPPSRIPDGIIFGASDTTMSEFSLFPIPLLGKNKADVKAVNKSVKFVDTKKNSWGNLGVNLGVEYTPQELSSLIVTLWTDVFKKMTAGGQDKKSKKVKRLGVNIVVPSYFSQRERIAALYTVKEAGHTPKYVFSRALAAVVGSLRPMQGDSKLLQLTSNVAKRNGGKEPLVIFVHVDNFCTDIGLLSCEGADKANIAGNMLGFERVVLCSSAGSCKVDELVLIGNDKESINASVQREKMLRVPIETVLSDIQSILKNVEKGMVSAILCSGLTADESKKLSSSLDVPFVNLREGDIVAGGCFLAAAELESSKQYIAQEDEGWSILHCLPVGEECITSKIFLREQLYEGGEVKDFEFVEPASRLWKTDIGPARKGRQTLPRFKRSYEWGPIFDTFRKSGAVPPNHYALGWPKLTLVESMMGKPDVELIKEITPLYAKLADGKEVAISECVLSLSIDTNSGTVNISDTRKDSVPKIRSWYWLLLQIGCVVALIIIAVLSLYYYSDIVSAYNYSKDKAWLTDFYEQNAPEKLTNDPLLIKTLMDKHHKKMFVLWRKLQQTYEVKWKPPYSIVEAEL